MPPTSLFNRVKLERSRAVLRTIRLLAVVSNSNQFLPVSRALTCINCRLSILNLFLRNSIHFMKSIHRVQGPSDRAELFITFASNISLSANNTKKKSAETSRCKSDCNLFHPIERFSCAPCLWHRSPSRLQIEETRFTFRHNSSSIK